MQSPMKTQKLPSLISRTPDFDLMLAENLAWITFRQIAAGAFSRPRTMCPRPIDVVKTGYTRVETKSSEKWRHIRSEKSFPNHNRTLGESRISVFFLERWRSECLLLVGVVDAGGSEKKSPHSDFIAAVHVRNQGNPEHAECLIVFDESHATHIGCEVIDFDMCPSTQSRNFPGD